MLTFLKIEVTRTFIFFPCTKTNIVVHWKHCMKFIQEIVQFYYHHFTWCWEWGLSLLNSPPYTKGCFIIALSALIVILCCFMRQNWMKERRDIYKHFSIKSQSETHASLVQRLLYLSLFSGTLQELNLVSYKLFTTLFWKFHSGLANNRYCVTLLYEVKGWKT